MQIYAFDDTGTAHPPVNLYLEPRETGPFNSQDLERGNPDKGLPVGVGDGEGDWYLLLSSPTPFLAYAYMRTADGFVTSMQQRADFVRQGSTLTYIVPFMNPATNKRVSRLRITNLGTEDGGVVVAPFDDHGAGEPVVIPVGQYGDRDVDRGRA